MAKNYHILYKLTTRGRFELAQRALKSVHDLSYSQNHSFIITCDDDDFDLPRWKEKNYPVFVGKHTNKVNAINNHVPLYGWDILVNLSDDQFFTHAGFDNIIREQFDNLDMVLHLPDDNRKDLMTMSIIGNDYYQLDKRIYCHLYYGQFCDDEAMHVAKIRGKYKYHDEVLFSHSHPNYGKAVRDASYEKYDKLFHHDKLTYDMRLRENFGL